jgi:septal ring factor EnvC (AmiA/AmiB activator)
MKNWRSTAMLKMKTTVAIALTACMIPAFAQTPPAKDPSATPGIDKRQAMQQKRIDEGVKSGALTGKEAAHLQQREAKIEADKQAAKADGKVTPRERKKLNRELDSSSRAIHHQKHDAQAKKP